MTILEAFEKVIAVLRGPQLTVEQQEARNKTRIIATFCIILVMMVAAFILNTTSVEQPMKDLAPADKFNYDTLKLIATQIFTVLTLLLGKDALKDKDKPDTPPVQVTTNVTTEANANDESTQSKGNTP